MTESLPHGKEGESGVAARQQRRCGRRAGAKEGSEKLQVLSREDMVHYVDVRDAWDRQECECCFDRAVSYCAQLALRMVGLAAFRSLLLTRLPDSIPLVPFIHPSGAIAEYSAGVHMKPLDGSPPQPVLGVKCVVAPMRCAEAMILEWMAEPLVQLGAARQFETDCLASMLVQVLGVKGSAEVQEGFGFFVQHVLSGGLEKAHAEGRGGAEGGAAGNAQGEEGRADGEGMYVSGVSATDFALALALELSNPESCMEAVLYMLDGNNANKVRVEEAAIEEAGSRLRRGVDGAGSSYGSGLMPVNTSPVLAAFTYRVARILHWVRFYGSDILFVKGCSRSRREKGILQMPHPFRDLPSLLIRLGAIPKPLDDADFPMEWEEWSQGDEAAAKLPDDPDARFFRLGILEESATGVESRHRVREQISKCGRKHIKEKGRRAKASGQASDVTGGDTNGGFGEEQGGVSHASGMAAVRPPPPRGEVPIIRCVEDAEFMVDATSLIASPPPCASCIHCYRTYTSFVPSIALVAKFVYRPLHVLVNRFLSVFPPHSTGFDLLVKAMGLSPFPPGPPALANLARLRGEIEAERLGFFMFVALTWPASILDLPQFESKRAEEGDGIRVKKLVGRKKGTARGEEEEEDDGEVWEELQSWCYTASIAWPSVMRIALSKSDGESAGSGLSGVCMGSEGRKKRADLERRKANMINTGAAKRIRQRVRDRA
ncbi:unnamed protein product [Closterium sp. Yama58-4]|nr:unnamed protein product [Closterium sp. Yama58-4]